MLKAPSFSLPDKDGFIRKLEDFKSDYLVVYFYPKDSTPGCTLEAKNFSNLYNDFTKAKTEIIGISGGKVESKRKFCEMFSLKVTLLNDEDLNVAKAFNSYGQKSFMGKKYMGIFRNTYILDKDRNIIKIFENVKVLGHAKDVLKTINAYSK